MNFIKSAVTAFALISASAAYSAGQKGGSDIGSAFVNGETLYVTVLGDCNALGGDLKVSALCNDKRQTQNYSTDCSAELTLISTQMMCFEADPKPYVLTFNLKKANVAREAEVLNLNVQGQTIQVRLK